jgi:hypothetical protein
MFDVGQLFAAIPMEDLEQIAQIAMQPVERSEREVEVERRVGAFAGLLAPDDGPPSLDALADLVREHGGDGELLWARKGLTVFEMCYRALAPNQLAEFIGRLLAEYPDLRTKKGGGDGTPALAPLTLLHSAVGNRAPPGVLMLVGTPAAAVTRSDAGETPLHAACYHGLPRRAMEFLVNLNPDALSIQNSDGSLPIHCAFHILSEIGAEALRVVVSAHPAALAVRNNDGDLPLHLACKHLRDLDELAEAEQTLELIDMLIDARPDAVVARDNSGNTPIATSIEPDHSMEAWMRRLVYQGGPPDRTERTRRVIQFVIQRMLPRAPTSGLRDALTVDGVVGALSKVCKQNPDLELVSLLIELWILALCLSQYDPVLKDYELTSESRLMLLALVEILLHDTTKGAVPDPVRDHVRQSVTSYTSADELAASRGVVRAIPHHVLGDDLQQLRTLILRFAPLQELLTQPLLSGDESFQNFLVGVYLMNKAGRHRLRSPEQQDGGAPDAKADQHLRVLMAAVDNPSCLFLHLRDCDVLFARDP